MHLLFCFPLSAFLPWRWWKVNENDDARINWMSRRFYGSPVKNKRHGKVAACSASSGKVVWRVCVTGGGAVNQRCWLRVELLLQGFLVLCFQIIHLKTPEDNLRKVREPFPQQLHPPGPRTVCTWVFAYCSGPQCWENAELLLAMVCVLGSIL